MFNVDEIRKEFPMLQGKTMQGKPLIYFDNAATTLRPRCVIDAICEYYENYSVNAYRGDYDLSAEVDERFNASRQKIAEFINADTKEVVFTSGASEALNLVAFGYGLKHLKKGDVILTTEAEHASNMLPWMRVSEQTGATLTYIPLDDEGRLTLENVEKMMSKNVKVLAIAHVTNVLGYIVPIKEICALAHTWGAKVVVDGAQSVPHMPMNVKDMDCDFLAFSAHKMCGPTGLGILYGKYELLDSMDAFMLGGGSNARYDLCGNILMKEPPFRFESGTPAIDQVLSMSAVIEYMNRLGMSNIESYESKLRQYMIDKMTELDNVIIYNEKAEGGIVTFNIKDVFAQDAASYFNSNGIAVRSGQHCAKLLNERLETSATLRASLYFYNTFEEVDKFIEVCSKATIETCLDIFF